jgi:hypothetical protein
MGRSARWHDDDLRAELTRGHPAGRRPVLAVLSAAMPLASLLAGPGAAVVGPELLWRVLRLALRAGRSLPPASSPSSAPDAWVLLRR